MRHDIPIGFHELFQEVQFQMQFLALMVFHPINQTVRAAQTQEDNCKIVHLNQKGNLNKKI